jgi:hypothetical protein
VRKGLEKSFFGLARKMPHLHNHRAMKWYYPTAIEKIQQEKGTIAVTHKDLWMQTNLLWVELAQDPLRSVPPADRHDGTYLRVPEQLHQDTGPFRILSGKEAPVAVKYIGECAYTKPLALQDTNTLIQRFPRKRT